MSVQRKNLRPTPPWWTPADAAELDVLVAMFVKAIEEHRSSCQSCEPGQPWCAELRDAFDGIVEWRRLRSLFSRATWARRQLWEVRDAA